jgi:putative aminopeptidase FrvX
MRDEILQYAVEQTAGLCRIPSPTGYTARATERVVRELESMGFEPERTNKGNVLCRIGGEGSGLCLSAHVDTLGLIVRSIKPNGRIRYEPLNGYSHFNAATENVTVFTRSGREYTGTIQCDKPSVHVWGDTDKVPKDDGAMEVLLDEEVASAEDAGRLGIRAGDFIAYDSRTAVTPSGFIKSRHLDDKAGSACLLALARIVREDGLRLSRGTWLYFTVHEEVGHGCSSGLPEGVEEIVSVDMGAVGGDLGCDEYKVSICAKDSAGPYNYDVVGALIAAAEAAGCAYAVDVYPHYGSDADASLRAGYDVRHGLIGPGVYASHGYERTHRKALENTIKLLERYVTVENFSKGCAAKEP